MEELRLTLEANKAELASTCSAIRTEVDAEIASVEARDALELAELETSLRTAKADIDIDKCVQLKESIKEVSQRTESEVALLRRKLEARIAEATLVVSKKDEKAKAFFTARASKVAMLEEAKGSLESALISQQNEPKAAEAAADAEAATRIALAEGKVQAMKAQLASAIDKDDFSNAKTIKVELDKLLLKEQENAVQMKNEHLREMQMLHERLAAAVSERKALVSKLASDLSNMPRSLFELEELTKKV
jgi:hypothetical protein